MKNNNKKKRKIDYSVNDDTMNVKKALTFLLVVLGVCVLTLGVSSIVTKIKENKESNKTEIQSDKILVGEILTRDETDYYVLAYTTSDTGYQYYLTYLATSNSKNKVYTVDLDSVFNQNSVGEEYYLEGTNTALYKFKNSALLKISNGKIVEKYLHGTILDELKKVLN